jgi:hypothetical protein
MMRKFGWLVLCLCVLAGIGYYLDWFSFSASLNKDKFKEDMNTVKEKVHDVGGEKTGK